METKEMQAIIEGLLFLAGEDGLDIKQMTSVLELNKTAAFEIIEDLQNSYKEKDRGLELVEMAGTYKLTTKPELATFIRRFVETPNPSTLSQAALETLSIIAYKQEVTRTEVEEIRGVKTDRPLQTLVSKGLIKEVGRLDGPGRPILYGTTKDFLDYFGLKSLDELPPLPEPEQEVFDDEAELFYEKFQKTINDDKEHSDS